MATKSGNFENTKNGMFKAGKKVTLGRTKRKASNRVSAKKSYMKKAC